MTETQLTALRNAIAAGAWEELEKWKPSEGNKLPY